MSAPADADLARYGNLCLGKDPAADGEAGFARLRTALLGSAESIVLIGHRPARIAALPAGLISAAECRLFASLQPLPAWRHAYRLSPPFNDEALHAGRFNYRQPPAPGEVPQARHFISGGKLFATLAVDRLQTAIFSTDLRPVLFCVNNPFGDCRQDEQQVLKELIAHQAGQSRLTVGWDAANHALRCFGTPAELARLRDTLD